MNIFTEKQNLPKFSLEEIDNLIMPSNNLNLVKNLTPEQARGPGGFPEKFYKILEEEIKLDGEKGSPLTHSLKPARPEQRPSRTHRRTDFHFGSSDPTIGRGGDASRPGGVYPGAAPLAWR